MKKRFKKIKKRRTLISKIIAIALIIGFLFAKTTTDLSPITTAVLSFVGLVLCTIASLGRIWCTLYITGFKNKKLVAEGPYSMSRNPLYFYSFLGTIGLGLASNSFLLLGAIVLGFIIYYPFVIVGEEDKLESIYGADYRKYKQNVPRFFPKFSLFHEPNLYEVKPKSFSKDLRDCAMFIVAYGGIIIINVVKSEGFIKPLFEIF
ncbi:MAG: hypothetical protein B6226_04325 [Candidatus Cloacimonetes bacterium 4572_65]|nr:MAG: hypothetical protein B6226_04325 [Candidatus Cloacimonetes bacterium 4572_65]